MLMRTAKLSKNFSLTLHILPQISKQGRAVPLCSFRSPPSGAFPSFCLLVKSPQSPHFHHLRWWLRVRSERFSAAGAKKKTGADIIHFHDICPVHLISRYPFSYLFLFPAPAFSELRLRGRFPVLSLQSFSRSHNPAFLFSQSGTPHMQLSSASSLLHIPYSAL